MPYRTRTYIAAEWDGDRDLIETLRKWNDSNHWALHFLDAHELASARDTSLNCSIKHSLAERLARSKTFVLIVGENTSSVTAGGCRYCPDYSALFGCRRGHGVDHRSYIEYECDYAANNGLNIVVLYNYAHVHVESCPARLRNLGRHLPAWSWRDGGTYWNYFEIKEALGC